MTVRTRVITNPALTASMNAATTIDYSPNTVRMALESEAGLPAFRRDRDINPHLDELDAWWDSYGSSFFPEVSDFTKDRTEIAPTWIRQPTPSSWKPSARVEAVSVLDSPINPAETICDRPSQPSMPASAPTAHQRPSSYVANPIGHVMVQMYAQAPLAFAIAIFATILLAFAVGVLYGQDFALNRMVQHRQSVLAIQLPVSPMLTDGSK